MASFLVALISASVLLSPATRDARLGHQSPCRIISDPVKLGRLRAQFGDPYTWPGDNENERWAIFKQTAFGGTYMYFPAGVASRRYYMQAEEHDEGGGGIRYWPVLVLEGKRGKKIKVEWIAKFEPIPSGQAPTPSALKKMGTLEAMFARQGFRVRQPASRSVLASLRARKFFASYYADVMSGGFYSGHVSEDGVESELPPGEVEVTVETVKEDIKKWLPYMTVPYPITPAEKKELKRLRAIRRR